MKWIDALAMHWLGRRHGWPVTAGREFFYEPDESIEDIEHAWERAEQAGATGFTTAPPGLHGIYISPSSSMNVVVRDNRFIP